MQRFSFSFYTYSLTNLILFWVLRALLKLLSFHKSVVMVHAKSTFFLSSVSIDFIFDCMFLNLSGGDICYLNIMILFELKKKTFVRLYQQIYRLLLLRMRPHAVQLEVDQNHVIERIQHLINCAHYLNHSNLISSKPNNLTEKQMNTRCGFYCDFFFANFVVLFLR